MSNPGVIKLADDIFGNYHMWMDDNIGESIHLHINKFRIDMNVYEFNMLYNEIKNIVHKMIHIENFELDRYDSRFVNNQILRLLHTKKAVDVNINLGKLRVFDDSNICYLPECNRVKALKKEIDIDDTIQRRTNKYKEYNSVRLSSALDFIKKNGYPYKERYIVVIKDKNIIIDGWHKAACLFFLYGDIEIPVKALMVEDKYVDKKFFPIEKIRKNSRIILYGAGENGRIYFKQIANNFQLVAWCDKAYKDICIIEDFLIISPVEALKSDFDYIVISVLNIDFQKEIINWLLKQGVSREKIILP